MRYRRPLTIILFDVDGFKQANDTFGHATGDTILLQIAQIATAQIRNVDVLARYGGDEFIILLPQTHALEAFHIAERVRNSVAVTRVAAENSPFVVTLSIGVSEILHSPQDESVEDIIRRADKAMYKVKQSGGNHTLIYAPDSAGDS
jgi:diguanylate cyclase (GGDEF)-like protein